MTTDTAIRVEGLEKSYKDLKVLRGVDFDVARGSTFALLGSNGAGKTTVVRILATLLKADAGTAAIAGWSAYLAGLVRRGATPCTLVSDANRYSRALTSATPPRWSTDWPVVRRWSLGGLRDCSTSDPARDEIPTLLLPPQAGTHSCIVDHSADRSQVEAAHTRQRRLQLRPQRRRRGAVQRAGEGEGVVVAVAAGGHRGLDRAGRRRPAGAARLVDQLLPASACSLPALRSAATCAIDLRLSGPLNWVRNVCTKLTPSTITSKTFQPVPVLRIR